MRRYLILIFVPILVIGILLRGCYNASTHSEPTPVEQTAKEATKQERMELAASLQQVNDALVENMEEQIEIRDRIDYLTTWLKGAGKGGIWTGPESEKLSELWWCRFRLRDLQEEQVELEKERNRLLVELAKLGQ